VKCPDDNLFTKEEEKEWAKAYIYFVKNCNLCQEDTPVWGVNNKGEGYIKGFIKHTDGFVEA